MKYIVYDAAEGPISAVIFPRHIDHLAMANLLELQNEDIISAGFVHYDEHNGVYCDGFSTGLGRAARPEDEILIRNLMK